MKGKQSFFNKIVQKMVNFERSQNSTKHDPNVSLDLRICEVNLLSIIITVGYYERKTNFL